MPYRNATGAMASVLCLAVIASCSDTSAAHFESGERTVARVGETVWAAGGLANDTLLLRPKSVMFLGNDIAVWDAGRSAVVVFTATGQVKWQYGRKGEGPGEFAGVTQIAADHLGRLWVLDPDNARISILDGEGTLVRAFPLPASIGHVDRVTPIGNRRALLMGMTPVLHVIDDRGRLVVSKQHPYQSYSSLHPISAYNRALYDLQSDSVAFFFHYGGGIGFTNGQLMQIAALTHYVEPVPFPEVNTQQTRSDDGTVTTVSTVNAQRLAVRDGTVSNGVVHLLFEGDSEYGDRIIDRYAMSSGKYLNSWILPDTARDIAVRNDLVVTLEVNPVPAIVVRRVPRSGHP